MRIGNVRLDVKAVYHTSYERTYRDGKIVLMMTLVLRKVAVGLLAFVLVMGLDATGPDEVTWHPTGSPAQSEPPHAYR